MSTLILNIRGTNGAGKTTLARRLLGDPLPPVFVSPFGTGRYHNDEGRSRIVIGRYDKATCGGCDTIKTQDEITNLTRYAVTQARLVVLEGLLVSGLYSRYAELARWAAAEGHRFVFVYLDTSLETAIARTNARRADRGKGPLEDTSNIESKHRAVWTTKAKAEADGLTVLTLPSDDPYPALVAAYPEISA